MKLFLIKWILPTVIELLIRALQGLAHRSDNTIDDEMVGTLIANKQKIIDSVRIEL